MAASPSPGSELKPRSPEARLKPKESQELLALKSQLQQMEAVEPRGARKVEPRIGTRRRVWRPVSGCPKWNSGEGGRNFCGRVWVLGFWSACVFVSLGCDAGGPEISSRLFILVAHGEAYVAQAQCAQA